MSHSNPVLLATTSCIGKIANGVPTGSSICQRRLGARKQHSRSESKIIGVSPRRASAFNAANE